MDVSIGVDHPLVEADTDSPPNPLPAVPTQMVSVSSQGPELATPHMVSIILRSSSLSLIAAYLVT